MNLMGLLDQFIGYLGQGKRMRYFSLSLAVAVGLILFATTNLFTGLVGSVLVIGFCVLIIAIYFGPTLEAQRKHKSNTSAIFLLNLLLGWTVVGWIVAAVWASTNDAPAAANPSPIGIPVALCSSCGKYSQGGVAFCSQCGKRLAQSQASA